MSSNDEQLDMELGSGIAAFESKHFASATKLLSGLAESGNPEAQYRMAIMAQNGLGMTVNQLMAYKYMKRPPRAVWRWPSMAWVLCTWRASVWRRTAPRRWSGSPRPPSRAGRFPDYPGHDV